MSAEFSLSDSSIRAVQIAQAIAKEYSNENFSSANFLKALLHKDVGLSDFLNANGKDQPIGSFFFLGPTGTGKTELAKSLAEFLFNDENA